MAEESSFPKVSVSTESETHYDMPQLLGVFNAAYTWLMARYAAIEATKNPARKEYGAELTTLGTAEHALAKAIGYRPPTIDQVERAAINWCGDNNQPVSDERLEFFKYNWRSSPELQKHLDHEVTNDMLVELKTWSKNLVKSPAPVPFGEIGHYDRNDNILFTIPEV